MRRESKRRGAPESGRHAAGGPAPGAGPPRLYLVDAMGLFFRAHFAFLRRPLTRTDGLPVGALYGFLQTLLALIREESARYLVVARDSAGPTFRHQRFPAYKAQRPETPAELVAQLPYLTRLIAALGLGTVAREGLEADDLIGSLVVTTRRAGWEVVIVSADKDFAQLIGTGVRQYVPARGAEPPRWIDAAAIEAKWGVRPDQFIDFLALIGDSSDNIPGVRGIGPKTAARLLAAHGSLDALYRAREQVTPPGVARKLEEGEESAQLSRELVTLRTDLELGAPETFVVPDPTRQSELEALLGELEFGQVAERLFGRGARQGSLLEVGLEAGRPEAKPRAERPEGGVIEIEDEWGREYGIVNTREELARFLEGYDPDAGPLAIDTETGGLRPHTDALVGISLAWHPGRAVYIPVGHDEGPNLAVGALREVLAPVLADVAVPTLGQNLSFDLQVLSRYGLEPEGPLYDTMLASYVHDPEGRHGLDELVRERLGHQKVPITELIGRGREQRSMAELPVGRVAPYACEDADAVVRLWPGLAAELRGTGGWGLFEELEMPLVPVLAAMETAGVALDVHVLQALEEQLGGEMERAAAAAQRAAGESFNLNSPKQLQVILFERLGLKPRRRTKTGFSTRHEVLLELAEAHPVVREVLAYRQLAKLKSTYLEALPRMIDAQTGRIHTQFHQTGTATGRLSSSRPNLQNIPVRTPLGREIRRAFVAPPGQRLLSADYSQVELRVLAHLSGDEHLLAAFRHGEDIHRATAARVFGVALDAVTPEMRGRAKTVNFGVIYGMGAQRLAGQLGIPVKEAAGFIADYFASLPGMQAYVERCVAQGRERGYVETLLGRRRYLPDLESRHPRDRAAAERMAVNTTIQGSAADLIKLAMIELQQVLAREHPEARLVLQVHDELLCEVPAERVGEVAALVRSAMGSVHPLRVPLQVEVGEGANWLEAHG